MHSWGHALRHASRRHAFLALFAVAGIIVITSNIPAADGERELDALAIGIMVLAGGLLTIVHLWPVPTLVLIGAALVAYTQRDYPGGPVYLCYAVPLYTLGEQRGWRGALAPVTATTLVLAVAGVVVGREGDATAFHVLVMPGWAAAAVMFGDARRARWERLRSLEDRARTEERLRIARDLHDVIAHGIAAINLQSGVAAHVIDRRPEQAAEALRAIRATSAETLQELRATLGVLRTNGDDEAPRSPAPGVDRIEGLVETAKRAGLDVRVVVEGDRRPLPATVDLAAYRIVQESLTNVMRHARASSADVRLRYRPDGLEVEIVDDGPGTAPTATGGFGIAGMRERVALAGGAFDAGPRAAGGFRVWARLPVEAVE